MQFQLRMFLNCHPVRFLLFETDHRYIPSFNFALLNLGNSLEDTQSSSIIQA